MPGGGFLLDLPSRALTRQENSDSEELCPWCDTPRSLADAKRWALAAAEAAEALEVEKSWASRRLRLVEELNEVDQRPPEQRRQRLRQLQLEFHPDKHQRGATEAPREV